MPHRDLLAALLPPVSYDANAPHLDLSLAMEGRELDRVQADGAAVLGALRPWLWQQWLPEAVPVLSPHFCRPDWEFRRFSQES